MTVLLLLVFALPLTALSRLLAIHGRDWSCQPAIPSATAGKEAQTSRFNSKLKIQNLKFEKPPYFGVFRISREMQLSEHSALMGGQFPIEKRRGSFKNPIFYTGSRGANRPKIELSELMVQKTVFFHLFTEFSHVF